jgi:hypothetical protein
VERKGYKNILDLPDCLDMPEKILEILKAVILPFVQYIQAGFLKGSYQVHKKNSGRVKRIQPWNRMIRLGLPRGRRLHSPNQIR